MASDGKPVGTPIHATAVAIVGRAILLLGPSRSGKSSLAAALIARSSLEVPIMLIGDDRILLQPAGTRVMARAHPRIAGFIERRGLGIVASPFIDRAAVEGIVCLGPTMPHPAVANFPMLRLVNDGLCGGTTAQVSAGYILAWLDAPVAAAETQVGAKDDDGATSSPKD